jgi:hypothetical protein
MIKWISASFAILVVLFAFQNCSQKSFSAKESASTLSVLPDTETQFGEDDNSSGNGNSNSNGSNTSTNNGSSNPRTPTDLDGGIVTTPPTGAVNFTSCQSFQELLGDSIVVPARTANNVCYYVRLMSSLPAASSGTRGEVVASDVIASPHLPRPDGGMHPYILGQKEITQLQLMGTRNVALSGSFSNAQASMSIDNFFLVEQSTETGSYRAWAYGTADAEPTGAKITVGNYVVDNFYSYASGGTAQVTAIDMTSAIPAGLKMSIRFRGLDCGASAQASNVFMVFH